jgi:hypothetical protein
LGSAQLQTTRLQAFEGVRSTFARQSRQTGLMMWCLAKDGKIIEIDRTSWHSIDSSQQLIILINPDES